MTEWQDIKSARIDGGLDHEILVWDGRTYSIASVWWFDDDEKTQPAWFTGEYRVTPTHWMPLPPPPTPDTPKVA